MRTKQALIEGTALVSAVAAAAGAAAGVVMAASGQTAGAPGITKGLSKVGRPFGGSMLTGLAVIGGSAALVSLTVYRTLKLLDG